MARGAARQPKSEGMIPTVREFLPWHVIEQKIAAKAAGNPANLDGVPDSGVYTSGEHPGAFADAGELDASADAGPLTYRVYTLAELEGRPLASAPSSCAAAPSPNRSPNHGSNAERWSAVGRAALVVLRSAEAWFRLLRVASHRPAAMDLLRTPLLDLRRELRSALAHVEWRKVGTGAVLALGAFFLLVFVVLTAADLTDDLKPSRTPVPRTTGDAYTSDIVAASHASTARRPTAAQPAAAAPAAAAPARDDLEVTVDIDAPSSHGASAAHATPARKAGKPSKKPAGEIFNP